MRTRVARKKDLYLMWNLNEDEYVRKYGESLGWSRIKKGNKVLLGRRFGQWCFPGGHLEFGEELEDCVKREVREELGINIKNIRFSKLTNDVMKDKHYISIFMEADYVSGKPNILEPHKCDEWKWFNWDSLPNNLFIPIVKYLEK